MKEMKIQKYKYFMTVENRIAAADTKHRPYRECIRSNKQGPKGLRGGELEKKGREKEKPKIMGEEI